MHLKKNQLNNIHVLDINCGSVTYFRHGLCNIKYTNYGAVNNTQVLLYYYNSYSAYMHQNSTTHIIYMYMVHLMNATFMHTYIEP